MTKAALATGLLVLAATSLVYPAGDLVALARTDRNLAASILVELLGAVVVAYLFGIASSLGFAAGGIAGAGVSLALLLLIAGPRADSATLLLAGVAISTLAGAALAMALALSPSPYAFYDALDWLMGSLVDRSLPQAGLAAAGCAVAAVLLAWQTQALDRLALGEEVAASLGHDLGRTRVAVIVCRPASGPAC